MASVFDVAAYVLDKISCVSTWKLQKLCYYSQAWTLAWTEKELFPEDFEAWSNGPVCPELLAVLEGLFMITRKDLQRGNSANLTDDEKDSINVVLEDYGKMQPYELRELTLSESPCKEARAGLSDGEKSSRIITKSSIKNYFSSL